MSQKKRVIVGMSGGVDSSVTAALLLQQGYDVIGLTLQLLPKEKEHESACCNIGAISDAKRVCNLLGIPHYTLNSRDPFQTHVIDNFVHNYATGFTPNPCVECNRYIKFDELWKQGLALDADYVATGHYCKIVHNLETGKFQIEKARDPQKDQSYFLYMMPQETLARTLFPLGGYLKSEIREIAATLKLINANRPDSQEICFVSSKSYKDFLENHIPTSQRIMGDILDSSGKKLGTHTGIYQFTIGQRKGLNISAPHRLYVIQIDPQTHAVVVGQKNELQAHDIHLHTFALTNEEENTENTVFEIKTRYQMTPFEGKIKSRQGNTAVIECIKPQDAVSPGQSLVLYDGNRIIGGGVILRSVIATQKGCD